MTGLEITDGWTVRAVGGEVPPELSAMVIPATVPGCVHLDLMRAGLIPDPYLDENERLVAWIARTDWRYETTLSWTDGHGDGHGHGDGDGDGDGDEVDLVALGLDTVATVEVNGVVVGRTRNMHRAYRFPVGPVLRPGENTLAVTFTGALTAAEAAEAAMGSRPHVNPHPYNALRKMACDFGWDWGPDLGTVGIWRPIRLSSWRVARIAAVRPLVTMDGATGVARVHVDVARASGCTGALRLDVHLGDVAAQATLPPGQDTTMVEVRVPGARQWWPHGYGGQARYDLTVHLRDGTTLDAWQGRIGFRTVTLDTTPDEDGTPFQLVVNGQPVFARGVNWIPGDCFPARVDRELYAARLGAAVDAHVNLIRVWGGGIYESDQFYDLCDELGLLVWQDFAFACAAYAEEEPLRGEVIAEAREQVSRLSAHPSLALWSGGNECIQGWHDWGWQAPLAGRSWGWGYYSEVLPGIVAELDPTRPYTPGSPYSLDPDRHPNLPGHGTMHVWDVWNTVDYTGYRRYRPRFVAEFGFQGPPTWTTLTRAIPAGARRADSPALLLHQKAEDGNGKLARGLAAHLPAPADFAGWHWAMSLNQARAVAYGIEHFRSLAPACSGAVLWQLNDVWPVISWSVVDGDGRYKPAWYALRRAFRDRLLTVQPRGDGLALVAVNDSPQPWRDEVAVTRHDFTGTSLATTGVTIDLPPRGAVTVPLGSGLTTPCDPGRELLTAGSGPDRAVWQFAEDTAATLPAPHLALDVQALPTGYLLRLTAHSYLRDLTVLADRLHPEARADRALITLLPGECATIEVRTTAAVDPDAFRDPLVLRTANQLVVGS